MRDINQNGARSTDLQPIRTESVALPEPPLESGTEHGVERTAQTWADALPPPQHALLCFCFVLVEFFLELHL